MKSAGPVETKQASPPNEVGERRRRWFRRWAKGGGAVVLAACLLTTWGWRYGFTPLPPPASGPILLPKLPPDWNNLTPGSVWSEIRRLTAHPDAARWRDDLETFDQDLLGWIHTGHLAAGGVTDLADWLARNPDLTDALDQVDQLHAEAWPANPPQPASVVCRGLWRTALARAAVACPDVVQATPKQAAEALGSLVTGYALLARLTPTPPTAGLFDERGPAEIEATLGTAFRRVALKGPPLASDRQQALDHRLATLPARFTPFAAAYFRESQRASTVALAYRRFPWIHLARGLRSRWGLLAFEWRRLQNEAWRWFGGADVDLAQHVRDTLRPLAGTGELLARYLQTKLARDEDFDRLWKAGETLAIAAAREGRAVEDLAHLGGPDGPFERSPWQRVWDRPPVWNSLEVLPMPAPLMASQTALTESLERARAALRRRCSPEPTVPSVSAGATATPR